MDIVSLAARPDLLDLVAGWQWNEWHRARGGALNQVRAELQPLARTNRDEACLIALDDEAPVGTASLTRADLDARPDLSPWLASVVVLPAHRGRGHGTRLVRAVEQAAVARGHGCLWLFTWTSAGLYSRLGWHVAGQEMQGGTAVTLMRRDLAVPPPGAAGR